jgi:hypothetical protein
MSERSIEYNVDYKDELLLVDFRASLQADIQKAWEEARQCKAVIKTPEFSMNAYLHDAYCSIANRLQSLYSDWEKWFPGEQAIWVVMIEGVIQEW